MQLSQMLFQIDMNRNECSGSSVRQLQSETINLPSWKKRLLIFVRDNKMSSDCMSEQQSSYMLTILCVLSFVILFYLVADLVVILFQRFATLKLMAESIFSILFVCLERRPMQDRGSFFLSVTGYLNQQNGCSCWIHLMSLFPRFMIPCL